MDYLNIILTGNNEDVEKLINNNLIDYNSGNIFLKYINNINFETYILNRMINQCNNKDIITKNLFEIVSNFTKKYKPSYNISFKYLFNNCNKNQFYNFLIEKNIDSPFILNKILKSLIESEDILNDSNLEKIKIHIKTNLINNRKITFDNLCYIIENKFFAIDELNYQIENIPYTIYSYTNILEKIESDIEKLFEYGIPTIYQNKNMTKDIFIINCLKNILVIKNKNRELLINKIETIYKNNNKLQYIVPINQYMKYFDLEIYFKLNLPLNETDNNISSFIDRSSLDILEKYKDFVINFFNNNNYKSFSAPSNVIQFYKKYKKNIYNKVIYSNFLKYCMLRKDIDTYNDHIEHIITYNEFNEYLLEKFINNSISKNKIPYLLHPELLQYLDIKNSEKVIVQSFIESYNYYKTIKDDKKQYNFLKSLKQIKESIELLGITNKLKDLEVK